MTRPLRTARWILIAGCALGAVIGCTPDAVDPGDRIGTTYGDGGSPYPGADVAAGPDASGAFPPDGTPGLDGSDGGVTVGAADTCDVTACGPTPPAAPTCYDGALAAVTCGRFVDGTCTWQLRCGP